ncbi:hypothetical protein DMN77_05120 [Paenibacillus sp. 79R4]|nr:hypothetical protein [Paenibacillus sp. 79R4]
MDPSTPIARVHTSQGLEFDYVGVIIGNDLKYPQSMRIYADFEKYKDKQGKKGLKNDNEQLTKLIKNIYKVLISRGMKGCFLYCRNPELRNYIIGQKPPDPFSLICIPDALPAVFFAVL